MKKHILIVVLLVLSSLNSIAQTLSNENFIYTAVPQKAVQAANYNTLTKEEINQSVTYFDGLGRPIQSIGIAQGSNKINNNLLDWRNTWTIGNGSVSPYFNQNGDTAENVRINGVGPFGKNAVLWQCVNDAANDADGGWNSITIPVDKTVAYRYAVWVKRTGSQNGTTYHGTQNVVNLDGSANNNPYFWYGNLPALDTWYLMVGMIQPASYSGGDSGLSGVYDTAGNKVIGGPDFKWSSTTTDAYFRSYLYYATDTNTSQYFYNPTVQKLDGTEASVAGLSADFDASDIVTHMEYDGFGRQVKEYLPYASQNVGNSYLKPSALSETTSFYNTTKYENTSNPFSQKEFEASPLNRVLQQAAPGNDWAINNNHTIKLEYQTNSSNEVNLYNVSLSFANNTYTPTLSLSTTNGGKYAANELYKTITKDENWIVSDLKNKTTEEFKDKEGRVVLKKTYNANETPYETYYIYDSYGNLSFVLPPKAEGLTNANTLNFLAYQYKYDYRNRLVEKKLPGKDWEYIVYDKLDRPILTQDVNLRATNKWIFTKYDAFGRTVYTGEYQNNTQTARTDVQTLANGVTAQFETKQGINNINGTTVYYSNIAFPNVPTLTLLTINYYDDYSFDLNGSTAAVSYGVTPITNAKGLPTGSKIRVLGTSNWITNVSYYDVKGRPIYNYSKNDYLATANTVKSQLDFPGKTTETTATHTRNSVTTTIIDTFLYDQAGRLLSQKQKVNAQNQEVIAVNNYDNLGQLTGKGVGGKINQSRLQNVDYTYNIRGWLKGINDGDNTNNTITTGATDLFGFQINYNTPSIGTPLYNGNISQTFWKTANMDSSLKNYTYTYDHLNRLSTATDNLSKFNENVSYDKNGNIINLTRSGEIVGGGTVPDINNPAHFGAMDNLTYIYDAGNRLQIVSDSANDTYGFKDDLTGATLDNTTDYGYDSNGNMKSDTNKNISNIVYNYLNLPTQVTIGGLNINYVYDATGTKLQKTVNSLTTDYAAGFIYEANQLKFFSQPEGYAANNSGTFSYIYQYKDHLGNVRLSYGDGNNNGVVVMSEIVEENNYYPFGLKHKGYNSGFAIGSGNSTAQKYKYNGKELQDELGLNMYDMEARNYMPDLGRWSVIDELAESFQNSSPYNFSNNNPILFSDPSGLAPEGANSLASTFVDPNGIVVEHRDDGDPNIYLVDNKWKPGNSKSGLPVLGFEAPGEVYKKGRQVMIDILTGYGHVVGEGQRKASGAANASGGVFDIFGLWDAFAMATEDSDIDFGAIALILSKGRYGKVSASLFSSIGKNSKKMTLVQLEKLLGKNWHQNSTKGNFMKRFRKELKGDTNADFYIDKTTNEVLLKSNKSKNWIPTGTFLN